MDSKKFGKWRDEIAGELAWANTHFRIWEQLWPTEHTVRIINKFRVFFQTTRQAHLQQFLLSVSKIMDKRRGSKSIWSLLNAVDNNPSLLQNKPLDTHQLWVKLDAHNSLIERIRIHRDKHIAHIDASQSWPDSDIWKKNPVTIGEAKQLMEDLEDVFNKISTAYDGHVWVLEYLGIDDTTSLINELSDNR